jgi:hypothetical protein
MPQGDGAAVDVDAGLVQLQLQGFDILVRVILVDFHDPTQGVALAGFIAAQLVMLGALLCGSGAGNTEAKTKS